MQGQLIRKYKIKTNRIIKQVSIYKNVKHYLEIIIVAKN